MKPIMKYYKKALCLVLEQIPRGHLIAAGSLSLGLMAAFCLSGTPSSIDETASLDDSELAALNSPDLQYLPENESQDSSESTVLSANLGPIFVGANDQTWAIKDVELPDAETFLAQYHLTADSEPSNAGPQWHELTIKPGDRLSNVFTRVGLNDQDLYELFDGNKGAKDLRKLNAGQKISFLVDENGKLQELKYHKTILDTVKFVRTGVGFSTQTISLKPELRYALRQGTINSSLFVAGKQAGLTTTMTMELANIFGWDVDFALDIKKGDSFKVMFEEQYLEGKKIGNGAILSAEFTNNGKTYKAVRYTNKEGISRFYGVDGRGMNKAFLRTPVDFARISSSFSLARLHPVLNTIRAHKGTDYAASIGTPVKATGDGKVIFAGRQGGYGNCIMIQHGQGYETVYGHLNNFAKGLSTGSRVSQGQVIAYVGKTGLASGPHLHYEFHQNGKVKDPVTVALPQSMGIAANEKDRFLAVTQPVVARMESLQNNTRLAAGEAKTKTN